MPTCILHTLYFLNKNYFISVLVTLTFKCKITPAQIPLIPFSVMHSINPVVADEPWPDPLSSAETTGGMKRTGKWQIWSTLEAAQPALHRNSFLSLAPLSFNSNGFRKKLHYHSCFWANIYSGRLSSELLKFFSLFLSYWSVIIGAIIHLHSLYSSLAYSSKFYKWHWRR